MFGRRSLRTRIVLVTLVLVSAGLVAADFATYHYLGSFLRDRVDQQLQTAVFPASAALVGRDRPVPVPESVRPRIARQSILPTGTYAALVGRDGKVTRQASFAFDEKPSPPRLPADLLRSLARSGDGQIMITTSAQDGSREYRLMARELPIAEALVVAIPLDEVAATQQRLLLIELAVTGSVILSVAAIGLWLIRRELRPLEQMGETAGAIAAGDLSQRVEPDDPRTEVGKLGAALNSMLARIERSFAERTESEKRLRRFLADASHELRTPVTSIRGYAELFRRGAADRPDDLALAMQRIEEEGKRIGELVDELLLLARLDQGLPLEQEPVDFAEIVAASVEAARATEPERPIALEAAEHVITRGAGSRLRQVIDNLLANVREHTPPRTPVHVRVGVENSLAVLEVADEGPGIPPQDAERVFDRFYRADRSRTRRNGGLGLGLSISSSLVQAHGGSVTYTPRPGGGSIFRVALPLDSAVTDPRGNSCGVGHRTGRRAGEVDA